MKHGYKLVIEPGKTYMLIMKGRQEAGRVCQHADGSWIGCIGNIMVRGMPSPKGAFTEVVCRYLSGQMLSMMNRGKIQIKKKEPIRRVQIVPPLDYQNWVRPTKAFMRPPHAPCVSQTNKIN